MMNNKERITLIQNNVKQSVERYNNNEITKEQLNALKRDASNRITELRKGD